MLHCTPRHRSACIAGPHSPGRRVVSAAATVGSHTPTCLRILTWFYPPRLTSVMQQTSRDFRLVLLDTLHAARATKVQPLAASVFGSHRRSRSSTDHVHELEFMHHIAASATETRNRGWLLRDVCAFEMLVFHAPALVWGVPAMRHHPTQRVSSFSY